MFVKPERSPYGRGAQPGRGGGGEARRRDGIWQDLTGLDFLSRGFVELWLW